MNTGAGKKKSALSVQEQLSLLDGSPVVIYTCRPDGDFGATYISLGVRTQLGWEPENFLENPVFWASLIHPEDSQRVFDGLAELFEHDRHSHQYRFRHKDGSYRWMNDELRLDRDGNGDPLRIVGYWTDITAWKQSEHANQHLAAIVESSADAILTTDLDGNITSWNAGAETAYGYSADEAIGKSVLIIAPEDRTEESVAILELNSEVRAVNRFESVRCRKDGGLVDVLITVSPIIDDAGETIGFSAIHRDITDRKQVEDALRAHEAQLRLVTDAMPALIFYTDKDLRVRFANRRATEWFGVSAEKIIGMGLEELRGKEAADASRQYIEDVLVDGQVSVEQADRIRDGEVMSYEAIRVPDMGPDGKVLGYFALVLETSERKQMEAALRESEARNLDLIEGSNLGIQIGSREKGRLFSNRALAILFGYDSIEELLSIPMRGLIGEADRERISKFSDDIYEGVLDSLTYEFDGLKKDGTVVPVQVFARRIYWGGGYAIQRTFTDMTDQNRAEEQLRQAQKMEAVGQLTGGIAHEFNNLLMVVVGNIERAMDSDLNDSAMKSLSAAMRGAMRGADLTNQLLAFSRKQSLNIVDLELKDLVPQMVVMLQRTLGETIVIKTSIADDLWPIRADETLLESALLNLSLNARDAMPLGGEIRITTANRYMDTSVLDRHPDVVPGGYVMLEMTDTGSGMSPEILEHVLEPFFTTKDVGEGTGLGLSMIHGFAEQSGGFLDIESRLNKGTSVRVFFPRGDGEAVKTANETTTAPKISQSKATILVVEDDPDVREIVVGLLSALGCAVIESPDGVTALALLEQNPDIDVLFTDVVLPGGLAGPDIASEARRTIPDLKVIFTSGYPDGEVNELAASGEQPWFIRKPYLTSELAELVERVLKT